MLKEVCDLGCDMGKTELKYTTAKLELHSKAAEEKRNASPTDSLPSFHSAFYILSRRFWTVVGPDIHISTSLD